MYDLKECFIYDQELKSKKKQALDKQSCKNIYLSNLIKTLSKIAFYHIFELALTLF